MTIITKQRARAYRARSILLVLLLVSSALSKVVAEPIKNLTCYSTHYPPYVIDEAGKISGIDVDVVKRVGEQTGVSITVKTKPWRRLEKELAKKKIDCVFAYFHSPEREKFANYSSVPLHMTNYTLFVLNRDKYKYKTLEDFRKKTIGVNLGFKTTAEFESMRLTGDIFVNEVSQDSQSFAMLTLGRIAAVLTNEDVGRFIVAQEQLGEISAIDEPLQSTPAFLVVRPSSDLNLWLKRFDFHLYQLLANGEYKRIKDRYFSITENAEKNLKTDLKNAALD